MAEFHYWTFEDVVDYLRDVEGGANRQDSLRQMKRAVLAAYREFPGDNNWQYYNGRGRVVTNASYSTGTIAYDHCVTPDHEALTRDGWKTVDQLSVGEEILAYDHEREVSTWKPIEKIHQFDFDGNLLEVSRKGRVVLRCTPNHRVPVWERFGNPRKIRKRFVKASELTTEHTTPLCAPLDTENCGPLTPRLAAVLAWCVTDGTGLFNRKYHKTDILQSITANPEKCEEIESLTGRKGRGNRGGLLRFPLKSSDRQALRCLLGGKKDLTRAVCHMGVQQASAAMRAMVLAEASTNETNGQKVFSQWGDNKPVAESFQVASLLSGHAVNICEREYEGKLRYQCPVRHSKGIKLAKGSQWVSYSGKVWCPQVETTAWVMRCNGAVMVTGNSGGANERQVTLTTGTWPSYAASCVIEISSKQYRVERRVSDSIITLDANLNPGADVASGTSYKLAQYAYTLEEDYGGGGQFYQLEDSYWVSPAEMDEWLESYQSIGFTNRPYLWTIMGDPDKKGRMALFLLPAPSSSRHYDYIYRRIPLPLRWFNQPASTVTISTSGTTATASANHFNARMVGSVIRFGANSTDTVDGIEDEKFFDHERIIKYFTSATEVELDSAISGDVSSVRFNVSDLIDVRENTMYSAFLAKCSAILAMMRNDEKAAAKEANYRMKLKRAVAADYQTTKDSTESRGRFTRMRDYAVIE